MSKYIFNYHRYRRKWGKKIERDETGRLHKKRNPFAKDDPHVKTKRRVAFFVILMCICLMAGLVLFHPFFYVSQISITGRERLKETDVIEAVNAVLRYKKWRIFPAKSFFLVDVRDIRDVLMSRFPLNSVEVKKIFPHDVRVHVVEKISTIIYDNGKQYSYIGLDGKIVEVLRAVGDDEWKKEIQTVTTTAANGDVEIKQEIISATHIVRHTNIKKEMGNYPIVYDTRIHEDGSVNDAMLEAETVQGILTWFHYLASLPDVSFGYVEVAQEFGDATIYTNQGWELRVQLIGDIEAQFGALKIALAKQINREQVRYIDIRYPGKVYWQ